MNIETAIKKGVNILKENNITNPYLDSEVLMTSTVNKDKKYIILNLKKYTFGACLPIMLKNLLLYF